MNKDYLSGIFDEEDDEKKDELFSNIDNEAQNKVDDLFNSINNDSEEKEENDDDELFNSIDNEDLSKDNEEQLLDDINNADDEKEDYLDDFGEEDDDSGFFFGRKIKEIQLSRKTILLGFGAFALIIAIIVGIISFIVIHNDKPPVAQIVHIESSNKKNKSIANYGDMITLSFTFNEKIKNTPTVIINGKNVEVFGSGRSFTANYFVIDQGFDEVVVSFSIEDYKDSFGKTGDKINNTTDLSRVVIPALNV